MRACGSVIRRDNSSEKAATAWSAAWDGQPARRDAGHRDALRCAITSAQMRPHIRSEKARLGWSKCTRDRRHIIDLRSA